MAVAAASEEEKTKKREHEAIEHFIERTRGAFPGEV